MKTIAAIITLSDCKIKSAEALCKDGCCDLYKPYKVHSYEQLAILAGLYKTISDKIGSEADFKSDWSVITNWCESLRYETGKNKSDTESFIKSIKEVAVWLKSII